MIVQTFDEAEQELSSALLYYAVKCTEVARQFATAYDDAVRRIVEYPGAWPMVGLGARRCLLSRFPYQIIYRVEGDVIRIFAVAHNKRRRGYWKKRASKTGSISE